MDVICLYEHAEQQGVDIDWLSFLRAEALSVRFDDGHCVIAINPNKIQTAADEKVKLAHELGHCETGSFYNSYSPFDVRRKHETRADRWAIKKLIPKDELETAVQGGYTELWELAEYFNVTEPFIRKAVEYYKAQEAS